MITVIKEKEVVDVHLLEGKYLSKYAEIDPTDYETVFGCWLRNIDTLGIVKRLRIIVISPSKDSSLKVHGLLADLGDNLSTYDYEYIKAFYSIKFLKSYF